MKLYEGDKDIPAAGFLAVEVFLAAGFAAAFLATALGAAAAFLAAGLAGAAALGAAGFLAGAAGFLGATFSLFALDLALGASLTRPEGPLGRTRAPVSSPRVMACM
jgi:hypothetical protein